jgi:hypothetical protein
VGDVAGVGDPVVVVEDLDPAGQVERGRVVPGARDGLGDGQQRATAPFEPLSLRERWVGLIVPGLRTS